MKAMNTSIETDTQRARANQAELVSRISAAVRIDGHLEPLKGVHLHRSSSSVGLVPGVMEPAFCVIAQGSKEVLLGDQRYRYDPAHYLLATVQLPVVSQVVEASPERPYLSFRLNLEPAIVSAVIVEAGHLSPRAHAAVEGMNVSPLDSNLLDAVLRLVRLIDSPDEARVLMPLITREIVYRLVMGEQGDRLRHIAVLGGDPYHIAKAIARLREDFNQPLKIDDIANELGMSVSGFHHHFKAVTAMSPLQYQKRMRLQEARRLMLGEGLDAASAGYRVGYNDASHFTREYKRFFGMPPVRDVERLRETPSENLAVAAN